MKDNTKLRPSWSLSSSLRWFLSALRTGIKQQQGFMNLLFAIVAGVLLVGVIWGPTLSSSSSSDTGQSADVIPRINYELHSQFASKEKSSSSFDPARTDKSDKDDDLDALEEAVGEEKRIEEMVPADLLQASVNSEQKSWDTASFSFSPKYIDWDKQRAAYLRKNGPRFRPQVGRHSTAMLVTSTSSTPCTTSIGTHLYLLATKNKLDYTRLHDIQFYYSMASPDPTLDGSWTKLALLRMLMVNHPQVDWFCWMDNDAWLTDMAFVIPFDKYSSDGKNVFLYGDEHLLYDEGNWNGIDTAVFGIRNCQWSLDLLDAWASFGIKDIRGESGKFLTQALEGRPEYTTADDQSALAYLLIHEREKWGSSTALDMSYSLSGHWPTLTTQYEEFMEKYHPGFGDHRWPFCVHFAGCQQCSDHDDSEGYSKFPWETCLDQIKRTSTFAEAQVLETMGFKLEGSLGSGLEAVPLHGEQPKRVEGEPYHIHPNVSDWDQQRAAYMKKSKDSRFEKGSKPRVLLVSGSKHHECPDVRGTHFLLKALKNKLDYAQMHDMDFYYNVASLDKELRGWWMKIPIIRAMMLAHPEMDWIWWIDSDAIITDMVFEPPFEKYKDVNLVLWGNEDLVFEKKSFLAINAGDLIIRNCQWSLDLLDSIIPMGPDGKVRMDWGRMLTDFLSERPEIEADDQSAILYMLITEKEKYASKTFLEESYILSGTWTLYTKEFEKMMDEHHPGLGDYRWPFITHFAGCQPCSTPDNAHYDVQECLDQMDRSLHFADNQVIHAYGLEHQNLDTWELQKLRKRGAGEKT